MANPSVSDIITPVRQLLREESGSDEPVVGDDFLILAIAEADREALRSYRKSNGDTPVVNALEGGFTLVSDTAVNNTNGVATTDVTVAVDAQTFPDSAGAAAIWTKGMPDVFFYTSQTSVLFSGITGLGFAHSDKDRVQPLYKLPSNFGRFRKSEEYGDGVQVNGNPLTFMEGPPVPDHFSMRDDGTSKYLWLYDGAMGTAAVLFDKDSNTIDSTDDLVSLGKDWFFFYIWRAIDILILGTPMMNSPLLGGAKIKADGIKLDLLKDRNVGRMVRVRQYGGYGRDLDYRLAVRENAL